MGKFQGLSGESFGMAGKRTGAVCGTCQPHTDDFMPQAEVSSGNIGKGLKTPNTASQEHAKEKAPMMNIRFTMDNYAYVRQESAMRGLSVTGFVNWLVDQYKADPSHVHTSGVYKDEGAW